MANQKRERKCPRCLGTIRLPKGSRKFTLDDIQKNHEVSCPGPLKRREVA